MKAFKNVLWCVAVIAAVVAVGHGAKRLIKTSGGIIDARATRIRTDHELAEASFPIPKNTLLIATDGEKCRTELWTTKDHPNPYHVSAYADEKYQIDDVRVAVYPKRPDNPMIRREITGGTIRDYLRYDPGTVERLVSEEVIPIPDQYTKTSGNPKHKWTFRITPPNSSTFKWREEPTQVARL